ncbi:hypothetical protein B0E44_00420 [Flavobacterium sp. A45]|nr:hypothetical protein B0E44_00420 [Flavobacterium sp. A45]
MQLQSPQRISQSSQSFLLIETSLQTLCFDRKIKTNPTHKEIILKVYFCTLKIRKYDYSKNP